MAWKSGRTVQRSIVFGILIFAAGWAHAQTVSTTPGGTIRTPLGRGIVLNKESTIERVWMTVQDPAMPVELKSPVGIKTVYSSRGDAGDFEYSATVHLTARQPLSVIEIRFMLFDIWGHNVRNLLVTEIMDVPAGTTREFNPKWRLPSETEAAQYYASIAYISRVKTRDGKVLATNAEFILEQARKFSAQFNEVDFGPGKREVKSN